VTPRDLPVGTGFTYRWQVRVWERDDEGTYVGILHRSWATHDEAERGLETYRSRYGDSLLFDPYETEFVTFE
jgi:hypothetical protein